jgi:SAM-dependent methyltransferase
MLLASFYTQNRLLIPQTCRIFRITITVTENMGGFMKKHQQKRESMSSKKSSGSGGGETATGASTVADKTTKSRPVPSTHLVKEEEEIEVKKTPPIELHHVRDVYDRVATQWAGTRYKAWPEVERFLREHALKNALVGEIGCGNGKNLAEAINVTGSSLVIANDVSQPLCEIASMQSPRAELQVADIVSLPLRSEIFDVVLCIAVLHHLSTPKRREQAVKECARVLRAGGKALFFAWAQEQDDGVSGHAFQEQDVFVPFHQKTYMHGWEKAFMPKHVDEDIGHGIMDESKRSVVLQRYCHVFIKGELEAIVNSVPEMEVISSFRDAGNWAVIAVKTKSCLS